MLTDLFRDFNSSIWHALWVLGPLAIGVFSISFYALRKGHFYLFDPKHNVDTRLSAAGDFGPHAQRYQDLAKLIITLSVGAVAFILNMLTTRNKNDYSPFVVNFIQAAPVIVGFFGCCIALLIGFMVTQSYWYEQYCHSPTHSTYTRTKYAISMSFGWTGLLSFILGFGWLAANIFRG